VLDPSLVISVRGIGRREHGLRECGGAGNAEEAGELCGIIRGTQEGTPDMRGVATLQDPNNTHSTREEHALAGQRVYDKGQRESEGKTMDHLISLSAWMWMKGRDPAPDYPRGGPVVRFVGRFRRLQLPAACMEKEKT